MKSVYETETSLDAHMILNLLQQEGIEGRVEGEYLQGGVGALQAINIVRVVVAEQDYTQARKVIDEWDTAQIETPHDNKLPIQQSYGIIQFLIGLGLGAGLMYAAYYTPISTDGVDYNWDGKLDEKWTYSMGRISKSEIDRNFDGVVDMINKYSKRGLAVESVFDEDFNGVFETEISYKNGNPILIKSDRDGDGYHEYHMSLKYGVLSTVTFFDPVSRKVLKIQNFNANILLSAEVDFDRNGTLDQIFKYDNIEEVIGSNKR